MAISNSYINSLVGPLPLAFAPISGVHEVFTLTTGGTWSGGTFTLTFEGVTSSALAYNINATDLQTALVAMSSIGTGNISVSGSGFPGNAFTVTFAGSLGGLPQNAFTYSLASITGSSPTLTVTEVTAGVRGSYRGAPLNTVIYRTDTPGNLYLQTNSDYYRPTWVQQ